MNCLVVEGDESGLSLRKMFTRDEVTRFAFDIWGHMHDLALDIFDDEAPSLALMKQGITYLRFDDAANNWAPTANGEEWTHAELTLRWSETATALCERCDHPVAWHWPDDERSQPGCHHSDCYCSWDPSEVTYATYDEARAAYEVELAESKTRIFAHADLFAEQLTEAWSDILPEGMHFVYETEEI